MFVRQIFNFVFGVGYLFLKKRQIPDEQTYATPLFQASVGLEDQGSKMSGPISNTRREPLGLREDSTRILLLPGNYLVSVCGQL